MFTLRFDMRAPSFGAPAADLYAAVPEMCAWAERHGALAAVFCEHHASDDGYLPAPSLLAAAVAARTERLPLSLVVILPFHDPVRLAEDMAVLDLLSAGRASYVFGIGYRAAEFEHFGLELADRGDLADEKLPLLRALLAGPCVTPDGRHVTVTPVPRTAGGPLLMWGGASRAAARRAGRYGLGLLANGAVPGMQEAYENACRAAGHAPGPTLLPDRDTPTVCFVADDVDAAWQELGPHLLHDAQAYAAWNPGNVTSAGITDVDDVEQLRATSASHCVLTVDEAVSRVRAGELLNLSPLCGGVPPDVAWPYLRRVGEVVMPAVAAGAGT